MEEYKALIETFYAAFQQGDYATMQDFYADESTFYDPVFQNLSGYEAGRMWEMLLKNSKDLKISLGKVEATEKGGTAVWIANYTFGKKRRPVRNKIKAHIEIQNGKIIHHRDEFDLRKWMKQALGWQGKYLGWLPILRSQIQKKAQESLRKYITKTSEQKNKKSNPMQSIVSTDWLQEHINDPKVILLFVMGLKKSQAELAKTNVQISGSHWFDLKTTFKDPASSLPNTIPNPNDFQRNCQELGINQDSMVVLYDASGIYASPRAWWLFRVMGHTKVVVLNGGLPAWQAAGGATEAFQNKSAKPGNFTAELKLDQIKYTDTILNNIKQQQAQVLDARSAGRFAGTEAEPRAGLSSGHIPGSKSLPYTKVLKDGKFKDKESLKLIFQDLELDERPLVFSCGSGITACINLLAAEQVLDHPKSVYDGSWTEWASSENLPIEKNG